MIVNRRKYLAGLDLDAAGCQIKVYQADGTKKAEAAEQYASLTPDAIRDAVFTLLRQAAPDSQSLMGLGITSCADFLISLDENDRPLPEIIPAGAALPPQAVRFMSFQDYIIFILTGNKEISDALAAALAASGTDPALLSRRVPDGASSGFINNRLALTLGLPFGICIIAAGSREAAAAIHPTLGGLITAGLTCRLYNDAAEAIAILTGEPAHAL